MPRTSLTSDSLPSESYEYETERPAESVTHEILPSVQAMDKTAPKELLTLVRCPEEYVSAVMLPDGSIMLAS